MNFNNTPAQTFGRNYLDILTRLVAGVAGFIVGVWLWSAPTSVYYADQHPNLTDVFIPIYTLACAGFAAHALWLLYSTPIIIVDKRGLRLQSRMKNQEWTWNEITGISGGITNTGFPPFIGSGAYSLFHGDKLLFRVHNTTVRVQELYKLLVTTISDTHRSDFIKRLDNGETLQFGKVKLHVLSIEVGTASIAMQDVRAIWTDEYYLMIYPHDNLYPWKRFSLKKFVSPALFMDITNKLIGHYMDDYYQRLVSGETFAFGPVKLSPSWVEVNEITLAISDIADVVIDDVCLMIFAPDRNVVLRFLLKDFYHPWVFQALVTTLMAAHAIEKAGKDTPSPVV